MRSFWWLFGLLFVCTLAVYVVGTGWLSAAGVNTAVRHGRRQLDAERVVADMTKAQQALLQHRDRVQTLGFVFPNPDFSRADGAYQQIEQFRQQFQWLATSGATETAPTQQFATAVEQLKAFRVPSLSVMSPGVQTAVGVLTLVLGVLAALLFGVRFLAGG